MLLEELLKESHQKYEEFQSLQKTCDWLLKVHGIEINRHKLSQAYHEANLYVNPPNGRTVFLYQRPGFLDQYNKLAADVVRLAWSDIINYLLGEGRKINYMSAAWFLSSPLYETCLESLNRGQHMNINIHMMPSSVTMRDIMEGKRLYEQGYVFWVCEEG